MSQHIHKFSTTVRNVCNGTPILCSNWSRHNNKTLQRLIQKKYVLFKSRGITNLNHILKWVFSKYFAESNHGLFFSNNVSLRCWSLVKRHILTLERIYSWSTADSNNCHPQNNHFRRGTTLAQIYQVQTLANRESWVSPILTIPSH